MVQDKFVKEKGSIVYIGGFELPDKNAAAHRVLQNAKIFNQLGYNVVFIGVDKSLAVTSETFISVGSFLSCPSKYPSKPIDWVSSLADFSHIRFVLNSVKDLKLVIGYNMHALPLKNLIKYCKKRNIKLVADVTEWYENKLSFNPIKALKFLDTSLVMKKYHKRVDGMIAISDYLANYYSRSVSKIIKLPPLVDIEEKIWYQSTSVQDKVEFIYAGSPGKDKDKIELLIDAFSKNNQLDFILNIVGMTREQFKKDCIKGADKLNLIEDKVVFFGKIDHAEVIRLLLQADCSIFIRERTRKNMAGFPTKFVEAVSAGAELITNDVSDLKSYKFNNTTIIDDLKVENIAKAIERIIYKGKTNHNLSSYFDYRSYIERMKYFIDEVLDSK